MSDDLRLLVYTFDGAARADAPPHGVILSGAFNPLHAGHEGMAAAAARLTGLPASYELAVVNADKGALGPPEILRRAAQFSGWATLTLSRAPLFSQKAALYPGRSFVLGYDTAARMLDPVASPSSTRMAIRSRRSGSGRSPRYSRRRRSSSPGR